jgi:hypothetical protein
MRVITELERLGKEVAVLNDYIKQLAVALVPVRCMNKSLYEVVSTENNTTKSKVSTEISNASNEISRLREDIQHLLKDLDLEDME